MRAGVAFCDAAKAFDAGYQLAKDATANGGISEVQLLLLFCNGSTHYSHLLAGARQFCGPTTQIIGGSAAGIICHDIITIEGQPAIAMALQAEDISFQTAIATNLNRDTADAGQHLAAQLDKDLNSKLLILLYDSVRYAGNAQQPAVLNPSPPLLANLVRHLGPKIPVAGAGLLADLKFSTTKQFFHNQVTENAAIGLLFKGQVKPYIAAMHGCRPLNEQTFTITRSFGQFIYELNKLPICQVLDQVIGHIDWRQQKPVSNYALGVAYPNHEQSHYSSNFVTRLISGILPNDEGIILFEPDLPEGSIVQVMQRSDANILAATQAQTLALLQQVTDDQQTPIAALYFDCAGRIREGLSEARLVQQQLAAAKIPMLGIYTGVEIAPIGYQSRSLDWSGVLILLTKAGSIVK